ncbi:MAG: histidine phosphatase family protein [Propionibacteriaceae bacterium]|jgi:probable phosphoglycerate mutase|nr:histidine phosphatase family protein [Propionibacteriaceae bacterium]
MRLILIRHGETRGNVDHLLDTAYPGLPLNRRGQRQAKALPQILAGQPIDLIFSSDINRAQQTAAPLARDRGLETRLHPGLREIQAGDWEMDEDWQPYQDVIAAWATDPTRRIPGAETGLEFMARFDGAVADLLATGADCVAAVSHGAAMRAWTTFQARNLPMPEARLWRVVNTGRIILDQTDQGWRVVDWSEFFSAAD